ncbi:MAG: cytochrome b/b6 domain-containing protein [Hyphomicrobiaceae bacterium]
MAVVGDERADSKTVAPRVKAWDLPTRLFHWLLALLILTAYLTRKNTDDLAWHKWTGYAILVLIVFRILWGFAGSSTARFSSFLYGPATSLRYALDFLLRRPRRFLGHNPLGSIAVFAMLGLVAAQGVLGLFSYDDHDSIDGGPLSGRISEGLMATLTAWHIWLFYILLYVINAHIAANVLYILWKRENLVTPMITGRKGAADFEDEPSARIVPVWRAIICLALAVVIVLGGIMLAGGKPF